ncbi:MULTISPECIES: DNA alkylation repair protein [Furfurilactobacillus]|uniref:DNA alkylation repair protein n=2 Tax=Furfurilactobacillus TaxID=2767882 RepID=A0ABT6DA66_9LACO|nr:DNA alkylation repair protein [Furfurilactobacillus milii]QLE65436.1 DNA alkylation repair enzyme [Furfurilactobacillus rossiae]MCF6160934.1 DNA alkylation repair protein [Furfurilactobacillus milii]MCF6163300.1 DNA alkylation repair protein [Furfurilactobacillus milii]MDF9913955.1 DNA alkylation repair protein [Furfurilactobacillus milii]MYV04359.1 DNA alkylation repair protein [Furfurilactobacillus milii]
MADALKDVYSTTFLTQLGTAISEHDSSFDVSKFVQDTVNAQWSSLKLMERRDQITKSLHNQLPGDFKQAVELLCNISTTITGFAALCLPNYVAMYGLDDWQTSMTALGILTQSSSAEFAIRPFLVKYPEQTIEQMIEWSHSQNIDQRRLASEGIRPRLPWGIRLTQFVDDPTPIFPILKTLIHDQSQYVQKSVANNLNDISKDHPQSVINFCQTHWHDSETTDWIINRGLRTLFKSGNPDVLSLLGYSQHDAALLTNVSLTASSKTTTLNQTSVFNYQLTNVTNTDLPLYLGYRVHYVKKNQQTSAKDFFIKRVNLKSQQILDGQFKLAWKQLTTRTLYAGNHHIELLVNTVPTATTDINLSIS